MILAIVYVLAQRMLSLVLLRFRSDRSKDLELVVLRHELSVLHRQVARPQLCDADRVPLCGLPPLTAPEVVCLRRHSRNVAALAPKARGQAVDISEARRRTPTDIA